MGFPVSRTTPGSGRISHFEIEDCAVGHTKRVAAHVRWVKSGHQLSALECPLMRHPLSEVCPALTASTTMRMAWMTTGALSIMIDLNENREIAVYSKGEGVACRELVLGRRVRSVDDRSEVLRSVIAPRLSCPTT
jgi:hypothetical protein